jgi:hypothetical protein
MMEAELNRLRDGAKPSQATRRQDFSPMAVMPDAPAVTHADATIDSAWFAAHPRRTCYARAHGDGVLVVRQVAQGRDQPPVLLRVWGQFERISEDEASCLALWDRCAHPRR